MPLVRYCVAMSIDGFIAPQDGSIDWLAAYSGGEGLADFIERFGGIVIGRDSFDMELSVNGWTYGHMPTALMTSRSTEDLPSGVAVFCGDIAPALSWLEANMTRGDVWLFGGGSTASRFLDAGAIDQIELAIIPVALGAGRPVFGAASRPAGLELIDSSVGRNGVTTLTYRMTGAR
jgi:dihydrofolate reductase